MFAVACLTSPTTILILAPSGWIDRSLEKRTQYVSLACIFRVRKRRLLTNGVVSASGLLSCRPRLVSFHDGCGFMCPVDSSGSLHVSCLVHSKLLFVREFIETELPLVVEHAGKFPPSPPVISRLYLVVIANVYDDQLSTDRF